VGRAGVTCVIDWSTPPQSGKRRKTPTDYETKLSFKSKAEGKSKDGRFFKKGTDTTLCGPAGGDEPGGRLGKRLPCRFRGGGGGVSAGGNLRKGSRPRRGKERSSELAAEATVAQLDTEHQVHLSKKKKGGGKEYQGGRF